MYSVIKVDQSQATNYFLGLLGVDYGK